MATLSGREARRDRSSKHTRRRWTCPICHKVCRGNGGKSAHQRAHLRKAGYPERGDWAYFLRERDRVSCED